MHPTTLTYKPPDPEVVGLIRELGGHRSEIVMILRALHAARGQLTPHLISEVARELHLPDLAGPRNCNILLDADDAGAGGKDDPDL